MKQSSGRKEKTVLFFLVDQKKRRTDANGSTIIPYDFSDLHGEQKQVDKTENIADILVDWVPFAKWLVPEKIMDPALTVEMGRVKFGELLRSPNHKSQKISGKWCLKTFAGGQTIDRKSQGFESSVTRSSCV